MTNVQSSYMQSISNLESVYSTSVHSSPRSSKPSTPFATPKRLSRKAPPTQFVYDDDSDDLDDDYDDERGVFGLPTITTIPTTPTTPSIKLRTNHSAHSSPSKSPMKTFSPLPALPSMSSRINSDFGSPTRSPATHTKGLSSSFNGISLTSPSHTKPSGSILYKKSFNSSIESHDTNIFSRSANSLDDSDEEFDYCNTEDLGISANSIFGKSFGKEVIKSGPVNMKNLPLDIKIIFESRPKSIKHDLDDTRRKEYTEFWHLFSEDVSELIKWNRSIFEKQNIFFEVFVILQTLRNNLKRVIQLYGAEFISYTNKKKISNDIQEDYSKAFEPLESLYSFIDKFMSQSMKPLYDNHFFVEDKLVLEALSKWFDELLKQFKIYSTSIVYLMKLYEQDAFRSMIDELDSMSTDIGASSTLIHGSKLFQGYLLTVFTSLALIFPRLSKTYEKMGEKELSEICDNINSLLTRINEISNFTSELDSKIELNERLVCIDHMWFQMIDILNEKRTLGFPLEIEDNIIYVLDNYVLNLKKKEKTKLVLSKPPIAIQYVKIDITKNEDGMTLLVINDCGNNITYKYKLKDKVSSLMQFEASIIRNKKEFFDRNSVKYDLKLIDGTSFADGYASASYNQLTLELAGESENIIKKAVEKSGIKFECHAPVSYTSIFCADCFSYDSQLYFIYGSTNGIYISQAYKPETCKLISNYPRVKHMDIFKNDSGVSTLYFLSDTLLAKIPLEEALEAYHSYKDETRTERDNAILCDSSVLTIDKNVDFFKIGHQQARAGIGSTLNGQYLFYVKGDRIYAGCLSNPSTTLKFETMRASSKIQSLDILYPYNFVISHVIDNQPVFFLSDLSTKSNTHLPHPEAEKELKLRLSKNHQRPVAAFNFYLDETDNDIILVYTNYVVFLSYKGVGYTRSRNETLKLPFNCYKATFDAKHGTLVLVGAHGIEVYEVPYRRNKKCRQVASMVGHEVSLLNGSPGKIMLRAIEDISGDEAVVQLIMHLRKNKNRTKATATGGRRD